MIEFCVKLGLMVGGFVKVWKKCQFLCSSGFMLQKFLLFLGQSRLSLVKSAASIRFEIWRVRGSGSKKFWFFYANFWEILIFPGKLPKNFDFCRQIFFNILIFFRQIFEKFRYFQAIFRKLSIFHAKIANLQLLLGKLFYFSSKVTTLEHTSCTW